MTRHSAGLLPYRRHGEGLLVFVAHMGGPFWARKDAGAWSIVKGEFDPASDAPQQRPKAVAMREFAEEIGVCAPEGEWVELGDIRQRGGKIVTVFAVEAPLSLTYVRSNVVELEWPRNSGRAISFPEVDRAQWMSVAQARDRLLASQAPVLDRLTQTLSRRPPA